VLHPYRGYFLPRATARIERRENMEEQTTTFTFTYQVTVEQGVSASTALRWLEKILDNPDLELPEHIFSVQTLPVVKERNNS